MPRAATLLDLDVGHVDDLIFPPQSAAIRELSASPWIKSGVIEKHRVVASIDDFRLEIKKVRFLVTKVTGHMKTSCLNVTLVAVEARRWSQLTGHEGKNRR
jgi:hypothetical protein